MKIPRVSIRSLMVVILVIAVASVALMRPTRLWAASIFSLAFAAFTVATLGAFFARGQSRASRMGFALGGWLGLIVHFSPLFASLTGENNRIKYNSITLLLPTTAMLDAVYPWLIKDAYDPIPIPPGMEPSLLGSPMGSYVPAYAPPLIEPELIPNNMTPAPATPVAIGTPTSPVTQGTLPVAPRSTVRLYWTSTDRDPYTLLPERLNTFLTIGYSLFCLLFAALTSLLAARKYASWSEPIPTTTG